MLLLFELHDPPRNVDGHRTRLDVSELLDRLKTNCHHPPQSCLMLNLSIKLLDKYQWVFSVIDLTTLYHQRNPLHANLLFWLDRVGPHTCWCDSPWTPRPLTVRISSPGQSSISSSSPPLLFVICPPSRRLPRRAAWPPGKIDLTKMPMLPRGLSRPPTTLGKNKFRGNPCETIFYLKPSPLLPCPLWNTAVWTVICKLRRASSPLSV